MPSLLLQHARHRFYTSVSPTGIHRINFWEWGDPSSADPLVVCAHGLLRNAHDFDRLADFFSQNGRHVISVDVAGRGDSDWLTIPEQYDIPQYIADFLGLLNTLFPNKPIDWIGTSMGGIIGMHVAAMPNSQVKRLVLNDVGPELNPSGLLRLANYPPLPAVFPDLTSALAYFKEVCDSWGPLRDEWLEEITLSSLEQVGKKFHPKADPKIGLAFRSQLLRIQSAPPFQLPHFWPIWNQIHIPVFIVRGEESDILSLKTAEKMLERPDPTVILNVPKTGHAPPLMHIDQIEPIFKWLHHPID